MLKHESITLKDSCAEDERALKVFCERTFHMRIGADHSLMNSSLSGTKGSRLTIDSLRWGILMSF